MTFKQLLSRYIKEKGLYWVICKHRYKITREVNDFDYFKIINLLFVKEGIYWPYHGDRMYRFFYDWAENKCTLKNGDYVEVETLDGKYTCVFKVCEVWHSLFKFTTEYGNMIDLNRIVKINGKPVDFDNGWYFKKDISNIH